MKKIIRIISFLGLALAFTSIDASAQAFGKKFDANVSFDFAIADKVLPAGKYSLRITGDPNGPAVLEVRNADRDIVFMGLISTNGERLNESAELRFDRTSGKPVLALIVSDSVGYSIPVSPRSQLIASTKKGNSSKGTN